MSQLICVGEILIDFLPGNEVGTYIRMPGGAPANVAVAAARLGINTGFCGRVGNDDFGRFLIQTLKSNDVAVLCPKPVNEAMTTMAFVSLTDTGERSFTFARKPGADMFLTCNDIDKADITHADMVHAGSCSLSKGSAADATRYALEQAHNAGKLVSFDVNYRDLMWDGDKAACCAALQDILPFVDFLKISDEEEDMLLLPLEQAAETYNISVVIKTMGAEGAQFLFQGKHFHVPGHIVPCVDSTGAGDAFWGAFLSCILQQRIKNTSELTEQIVLRAVQAGNLAGSLCVQRKGAMASLPNAQEMSSF